MTKRETCAVIAALQDRGHAARFVGGCVRDTLLGRPIGDIDIATDALPDDVVKCIEDAGLRAIPTGLAHGTVTAVAGGTSFEITTLRHDVETDGRHAKVRFTDDWEGDAARRDLTINAMSLEPDGTLHDPFGGRADLAAGRIRFVGDPQDRIVEDVLRLLRFFRFYAHYGRSPPDADALAACQALAPRLTSLSGERVRVEVLKLLGAPDPLPTLRLMEETKVFESFLPEATALPHLARLVAIETAAGIAVDPIRRLTVLLETDVKALAQVADRLRLSNTERGYLLMVATESVSPTLNDLARRRLIYRLGAASFRELTLVGHARTDVDADWKALLDLADSWTTKTFPITGADVLERNIPHGPAVGELLRAVEDWWVGGDFAADRAVCLAYLEQEIQKR
ncbi:MAG: CCA tRNA nucleotidyltransferase [Alphaproteobacteria bacterium]|nr:CCA tRNA nucleotidyltransferase [Alphaproteobacteria bacterium]